MIHDTAQGRIFSHGLHFINPEDSKNYHSSGIPKRAGLFVGAKEQRNFISQNHNAYIFDKSTFDTLLSNDLQNELIVDNWNPIAVIINLDLLDLIEDDLDLSTKFHKIVGNLPLVDTFMNKIHF